MEKGTKVVAGSLVAVAILAAAYFGSGSLFQGRLILKDQLTASNSNVALCSSTWTKVLDASISNGGSQLLGATSAQIKSLETAVENGCDLKVQLITYNDDKGANYVCDDVVLMKNSAGDTHVGCKSKTPFSFGSPESNHLYDTVVFSENSGNAFVAINRDWMGGANSIYTKDNNKPAVDWNIRAFLRK